MVKNDHVFFVQSKRKKETDHIKDRGIDGSKNRKPHSLITFSFASSESFCYCLLFLLISTDTSHYNCSHSPRYTVLHTTALTVLFARPSFRSLSVLYRCLFIVRLLLRSFSFRGCKDESHLYPGTLSTTIWSRRQGLAIAMIVVLMTDTNESSRTVSMVRLLLTWRQRCGCFGCVIDGGLLRAVVAVEEGESDAAHGCVCVCERTTRL